MSKQITPNEIAEIVCGLLIKPELLGELDSPEKHMEFMADIGRVVADHCGGHINGVGDPSVPDGSYMADEYAQPLLSVSPTDSLPSLHNNVWSAYDTEADWEEQEGIDQGTELTRHQIQATRTKLQNLLSNSGLNQGMNQHSESASFEEYKVVAMSTSHLTEEDRDLLVEAVNDADQMVLERETGFFIKLFDEEVPHNYRHGHSETIKDIIRWAHDSGYRMIEFDSDAEVLNQFPVFEW